MEEASSKLRRSRHLYRTPFLLRVFDYVGFDEQPFLLRMEDPSYVDMAGEQKQEYDFSDEYEVVSHSPARIAGAVLIWRQQHKSVPRMDVF